MNSHITSDWNNRDETVTVDESLLSNRILIVRSGKVDEAVRVDVDELLEAIYEEYPDRRQVRDNVRIVERAEPEWYSAKVISVEHMGRTRYLTHRGLDSRAGWTWDTGTLYSVEEIETLFDATPAIVVA